MNSEPSNAVQGTPEEDYASNFMPAVHRTGRLTMFLALILSFLPVVYFIVVKGYTLPWNTYLSGIVGVFSIGIGMWLSEPEAYWPVLGSAGTYISYLSGNVGGMRFPVATAVQKNMNADINTPRGQVITIIGIVASVYANLIILLVIVLAGEWILKVLPEAVTSAFSFVMVSMLGAMLVMNMNGKAGFTKGLLKSLPYFAVAILIFVLCNIVIPSMFGWGMAIAVGCCILVGYAIYRRDLKKLEKENSDVK